MGPHHTPFSQPLPPAVVDWSGGGHLTQAWPMGPSSGASGLVMLESLREVPGE